MLFMCSIPDCDRPVLRRGWCSMHYHRWQRYGDPNVVRKPSFIDLTGQQFGRLKVISRAPDISRGDPRWNCVCSCGTHNVVLGESLRSGNSRSCGCYRRDLSAAGGGALKHGARKTKEYDVWAGMIQRCTNPNHKSFHRYGSRGITVCDRWLYFSNFFADMGMRPEGRYSLDRINNNLGYSPDNCRWATDEEQASNRRKRIDIEQLRERMRHAQAIGVAMKKVQCSS